MRPFAFKHQHYLLEEICKNTVILPNYKFVNKKNFSDFDSVLLFPNPERELYLSGLGFRVYVDDYYDKNRLLFSSWQLLDWFVDDRQSSLDLSFSLRSVYLMK